MSELSPRQAIVSTSLGHLVVRLPQRAPDLLLWPGVFFDHRLHEPLAAELLKYDIQTGFIEPPGFGGSTLIRAQFSIQDCGEAMLAVVQAVSDKPIVVGGTSWGGATSFWAGLQNNGQIKGLVAMNAPYDQGHQKGIARWIPSLVKRVPAGIFSTGSIPDCLARQNARTLGPQMVRIQTPGLSRATAHTREILAKMVFWGRDSLFEPVRDLGVPALVVAGVQDRLCPIRYAKRIVENTPDVTFFESFDTGHLTALERPAETAHHIAQFMERLR